MQKSKDRLNELCLSLESREGNMMGTAGVWPDRSQAKLQFWIYKLYGS